MEIKAYYETAYPQFHPSNIDSLIENTFTNVDFDVPFESEEPFVITITLNSDLTLPSDVSAYEVDTDVFDVEVSGNKVILTLNGGHKEELYARISPNSMFVNTLVRNPLQDSVLRLNNRAGSGSFDDIPATVVLTIRDVDVSTVESNKDYSITAETEVAGGKLSKTISLPAYSGGPIPPYKASETTFKVAVPTSTATQNLNSETYGDGTDFVLIGHNEDGVTQLTVEAVKVEVKVNKVDNKGNPVSGAVLAVKDSSGKNVDQWTTDGSVHTVEGLEPDSTYTLTELSAPSGYEKAADIKFSTDQSGRTQVLKMVDKKKENKEENKEEKKEEKKEAVKPTINQRKVVPNTYDEGLGGLFTAFLVSVITGAAAAYVLKKY